MGWEGPMTHRQFLAWQAWLRLEWNKPSRSDHYAMQIALAVDAIKHILSQKKMSLSLDKYKIKFEFKAGVANGTSVNANGVIVNAKGVSVNAKKVMSEEERRIASALIKSRWLGMLGVKK